MTPLDAVMRRAEEATDGVRDLVGYRFERNGALIEAILDIDHRHLSRAGALHGGIPPLLLTVAGSLAVYCADPKVEFAANTMMSVSFLSSVSGGRLVASGTVERLGRTLAHVTARLVAVEDRPTIAFATCVYRVVRRQTDEVSWNSK